MSLPIQIEFKKKLAKATAWVVGPQVFDNPREKFKSPHHQIHIIHKGFGKNVILE